MLTARDVVYWFSVEKWDGEKWQLFNLNNKKFEFDIPENYWFPSQIEKFKEAQKYTHSTEFYRVWAIMVLTETCALVYSEAEKEFLENLDRTPKGKDFQKAENYAAQKEQEFLEGLMK